jgi:hypothetical protein
VPLIELGGIDSDLGRNKFRLCNRAVVIAALHSQRIGVPAPVPYIKVVMWHGYLRLREARQQTGPPSQLLLSSRLLLLLALGVGLITLLGRALGVLLGTLRMLHSLRVIALAVLLSGSPMRLRRIFVKFSGLVVIAIRHMTFLKFSTQGATIRHSRSRSGKSRNGAMSISRNFHHTIDIATAVEATQTYQS